MGIDCTMVEYKVVSGNGPELELILNELASKGWRVVAAGSDRSDTVIMERV
tara:strand:+ start:2808 stop:2960 length:153 start_codon:yes stop_codon:yes gene_type:complete